MTDADSQNYMPWDSLIQAFLRGLPRRLQSLERSGITDPVIELRNYRVLTIGGPRQCGKTKAGLNALRWHEKARFLTNNILPLRAPRALLEDPVLLEKSFDKTELTQENLLGVKILVIDNQNLIESRYNPYSLVEYTYNLNKEWFDSEFTIIRIL